MRTLLAFLLMAGAAVAQGRKIEGTAREGKVEEAGQSRPVLACEGTTDLPDGSRLDIRVYFGRVDIGRHLLLVSVEVKDGKFAGTLPVFARRNLAGAYVVHVEFNPYLQSAEVQQKLGKQLRLYDAQIPLTIGTDKDQQEDRRRILAQLGAEVESLRSVVNLVVAKLAQSPKADEWERATKDWAEMLHQIESRCHDVPEYKALRLDDISSQAVEDLAHSVQRLIEAAGACLAKPGDPEAQKTFDQHRNGFEWMRRPIALRLGIEKATSKEILEMLPNARLPVDDTAKLYVKVLRGKDPDQREYFKAVLKANRQTFRELLLELVDIAPERHLDALRAVLEKGTELFQVADEAKELTTDRKDDLLDRQSEFSKAYDALLEKLKE